MAITTTFENGVFTAYDDGRAIVYQPFKPNPHALVEPWASEQEALDWWEFEKRMQIDRNKYDFDANNNIILIGSE
jgi:Leu/Phe-tRNA-protein transferase